MYPPCNWRERTRQTAIRPSRRISSGKDGALSRWGRSPDIAARCPYHEMGARPASRSTSSSEGEIGNKFSRSPQQQRRDGQREQREAKRIDLRVVAVVEQVEHAQGERFAAGRDDQDDGFHVPEAEQ